MTRKHEITWGAIVLILLFVTAIIAFKAQAYTYKSYEPKCTEIHKQDSSPKGCDLDRSATEKK